MKKILLIDDEPDICDLVSDALREQGFEVAYAENGDVGLELARREPPDLILCDLWMPQRNGFETLRALRSDPGAALVPFIFLSGDTDRAHMRHGMESGADDYLPKPFTIPELLGAVRGCLERRSSIAEASETKLVALRESISFSLPHELMTPLDAILGFSTFLRDAPNLPSEEVKDCAQRIHTAGLRLKRTVENSLLYSQIELLALDEAKVAALRRLDPIPACEVITLASERKAQGAERRADLELELERCDVRFETSKLEKIFSELMDNAFKFSPPQSRVRVSARKEGEEYIVQVTNRGRGFTPEQLRSIGAHMQFRRRLYEQQGAGLGLVIAKRLLELHGGSLSVESIPEELTSVVARLPVAS